MLPARHADLQIPSLTRERTVSTLLPATPADPDDPLLRSRPVSLPRSARERDNKVKCFMIDDGSHGMLLRAAVIWGTGYIVAREGIFQHLDSLIGRRKTGQISHACRLSSC
jgi:hypothetical protein